MTEPVLTEEEWEDLAEVCRFYRAFVLQIDPKPEFIERRDRLCQRIRDAVQGEG